MNLIKHIQVTNEDIISIDVDKVIYYQGYIRSDQMLNRIVVLDAHDTIIKTFLNCHEKEAEIFWFIEQPGHYRIKITVNGNQSSIKTAANIELSLTAFTLKKNQYLSPPTPILSPQIQAVAQKIKQNNTLAEKNFWQMIKKMGTPLIETLTSENVLLTFLFQGNVNNVKLLGAPYEGHSHLTQLLDSTIWYKSFIIPKTSRFSYRVAANVPQLINEHSMEQRRAVLATIQTDPLNQQKTFAEEDNFFGAASTLTLNSSSNDKYLLDKEAATGTVKEFTHMSQCLHKKEGVPQSRKIAIYQPNSKYKVDKKSPLLLLFDGDAYLTKVPTATILDNLIADKIIPPTNAVFINNPLPSMREKELTPNQEFAHYMAYELMDWLSQEHSIMPPADKTILSGSSFGGLASAFIALQYPEKFGNVLSQSGSFWWSPPNDSDTSKSNEKNWFAQQITKQEKENIRFYLNAGLFETQPSTHHILNTNRQLHSALKAKGYCVNYEEFASGHDYFSWRVTLINGLMYLLN